MLPTLEVSSTSHFLKGPELIKSEDESPCDKLGAHLGYSFRNLGTRKQGSPGDRVTVRQQP